MIRTKTNSTAAMIRLSPVLVIGWLLAHPTLTVAHDSCLATDPTPDHPDTHPHCNPDKPGGNGNGGTGSTDAILGTEFDDGGGPDPGNPLLCVDLANAVYGTSGDDSIDGLGGSDCLVGKSDADVDWGNDWFHGGDDNAGDDDWMLGGPGDDVFGGGPGLDVMLGGAGNDTFFAAGDADYVDGGDGWDIMNFNVNNSRLIVVWDVIAHPVAGSIRKCDTMISGSYAPNTITDVIDPANPITDQVFNIEDIIGTPLDDVIFGSNENEASSPRRGDDCVDLGGGNDKIFGDRGRDVVIGGAGSDIMRGGEHPDQFHFYDDDFLAGGEVDIIEDFSLRQDCIDLNDIPFFTVLGPDDPGQGGSAPDTVIEVQASNGMTGTIRLWDVVGIELGCAAP